MIVGELAVKRLPEVNLSHHHYCGLQDGLKRVFELNLLMLVAELVNFS